ELAFAAKPQPGASLGRFLLEGVHHILIGADHLLFLTALLLPSVLRRRGLKMIFIDVAKLVTAFTVAHSLTLALAALDVVDLPSRLAESTIAGRLILAPVSNHLPQR